MLNKNYEARQTMEIVNLEWLVPKNHLLRKIDAAADFKKIYACTEDLYGLDNGRPGADPVVLLKRLLIQPVSGIRSLRQTAAEVEANAADRWFIGCGLNKSTPHFSTLSHNFLHRFTKTTADPIFEWILNETDNAGFLTRI